MMTPTELAALALLTLAAALIGAWLFAFERRESADRALAQRLRRQEVRDEALVPEPVKGWGDGKWPFDRR